MSNETLGSAQVVLAPLRDDDSGTMFRWINDRELVIKSAPFRPVAPDAHEEWFASIRRRPDVVIFGIRLKEDDRLIGSCQLNSLDPVHSSAQLQIRIGEKEEWGKGYGSQSVSLLLGYAFCELGLHRVWLHVLGTNPAAVALYERAGFRHEGVQRQAASIEGEHVDVVLMGMLRGEYVPRP